MHNRFCFVFLALLVVSMASAQQVGTVTAGGPFKLRGTDVPATAAQGLPLLSGDAIETAADPAILLLQDGSRATLGKGSLGNVARQDDQIIVCIDRGTLRFSVPAGSRLLICALGRSIIPLSPSEGTVTIVSEEKVEALAEKGTVRVDEARPCSCVAPPPTGWSAKKKKVVVIIVAAAAAAGTAAGIAAAREEKPPPVSPARR